mmetsp:Transcript_23887/g.47410  ORF Transcript_23887/g.47410 Transcript_23887/m.47410 type:complete len:101 (-) Transcript_23887:1773-2075(-)
MVGSTAGGFFADDIFLPFLLAVLLLLLFGEVRRKLFSTATTPNLLFWLGARFMAYPSLPQNQHSSLQPGMLLVKSVGYHLMSARQVAAFATLCSLTHPSA